jgi:hypothetical protein
MVKTGRPTKFNADRAAIIIDLVRKGNFKETAARAARITTRTLDNWVAAGKKAKSGRFFDFFTALELADAEAEANAVERWINHQGNSPEAAKEYLRRRFPHWNVADKQEIKQENTESDLTKDRMNEYFEQLKRRGIPRGLKESALLRDGADESVYPSGGSTTDDETDRASDE